MRLATFFKNGLDTFFGDATRIIAADERCGTATTARPPRLFFVFLFLFLDLLLDLFVILYIYEEKKITPKKITPKKIVPKKIAPKKIAPKKIA